MKGAAIGDNVRRLRIAKRLSQAHLAKSAGITRPALARIESGQSVPKVSTLQGLAAGLGVPLQDLMIPARRLRYVRFRVQSGFAFRDAVLDDAARWLDDYRMLEEIVGDSPKFALEGLSDEFRAMQQGEARAIRAAERAREVLELGNEPLNDVCGLMNYKAMVKIYPRSFATEGFFGLSVASLDGGPAVIVNVSPRITVERWIFTAIHEMGHLILHQDEFDVEQTEENERAEREADLFAAFFLMPEPKFRSEWEESSGLPLIDSVFKLKKEFKVSYRTVLHRLQRPEYVGPTAKELFYSQYERRYKSTLGPRDEPEPVTSRSFDGARPEIRKSREPYHLDETDFIEDRLSRLVRRSVEKEEITLSRAAEILRVDLDEIRMRASEWALN